MSLHNGKSDSEEEDDDEEESAVAGPAGPASGVWGASRPSSPAMAQAGGAPVSAPLPLPAPTAGGVVVPGAVGGGGDNGSEASSSVPPPPPRPKSRSEPAAAAKYNNLSYWRARR